MGGFSARGSRADFGSVALLREGRLLLQFGAVCLAGHEGCARLSLWLNRKMTRNRLAQLLLGLTLFGALGSAQSFTGKVVSVHDGDTLTVLVDRRQFRVRLSEIDAPELKQPFGHSSRMSLANLCFEKLATVQEVGTDRYRRILGRVTCGGVNVNAEQVRRGMAWVFDRYLRDQVLYSIQSDAKASRRGLWVDSSPVFPWEWREAKSGR